MMNTMDWDFVTSHERTEYASFSNAPSAFINIDHKVTKKSERADTMHSVFSNHDEHNRLYFPKMAVTVFLFQGFSRTVALPIKRRAQFPTLNLAGLCGCIKDGSPVGLTLGDTWGGHCFQWVSLRKALPVKPARMPRGSWEHTRGPGKVFHPRAPSAVHQALEFDWMDPWMIQPWPLGPAQRAPSRLGSHEQN